MKSINTTELRTTMPASAIMPIIAVAVKKTGFGWPPIGWSVITFKQPEAGHDADHRQRNRQHDQHRQHPRTGLKHQDDEDAQQGCAEGQPEVAKHVQRDLPFAFAGPLDASSRLERTRRRRRRATARSARSVGRLAGCCSQQQRLDLAIAASMSMIASAGGRPATSA